MRLLAIVLTCAVAAAGWARDAFLLVQAPQPGTLVPVANYLAGELEQSGRTSTVVVWSLTDPIFRNAVAERLVPNANAAPTLERAFDLAGKLKLGTVLWMVVEARPGGVRHRLEMYRDGKLVWQAPSSDRREEREGLERMRREGRIDERQYRAALDDMRFDVLQVTSGQDLDAEDTGRSIARTWAEQMFAGPMRGTVERPVQPTPPMEQGQAPRQTEVPIVPKVRVIDNTELRKSLAALANAGQPAAALNLLRDAVDQEPTDYERRVMLIGALLQAGQAESAASEARRAARLMPDQAPLRAMAARAWLQAGNADEAQEDLNEAAARDPEGLETRLLLAEVAMRRGDAAAAVPHLDKAAERGMTADLAFRRAFARALAGNAEGMAEDLKRAAELGLASDPLSVGGRYAFVADVLDSGDRAFSGDAASLLQRAVVQRTDAEVARVHADFLARVEGRIRFLDTVAAPDGHKKSHAMRLLAYKLLAQGLSDTGEYLRSGAEDVLADARINLGEAIRQANAARDAYRAEAGATPAGAGPKTAPGPTDERRAS